MTSEESYHTEEWSNVCLKFSFASEINYILEYIQIKKCSLKF